MRKLWALAFAIPLALVVAAPASAAAPRKVQWSATIDLAHPGAGVPVTITGGISATGNLTPGKQRFAGPTVHGTASLALGSATYALKDAAQRTSRTVDHDTCTATEKYKGAWVLSKAGHPRAAGAFTATVTAHGTSNGSGGCSFASPTGTVALKGTGYKA